MTVVHVVQKMVEFPVVFVRQMSAGFREMESFDNCPAAIVTAGAVDYGLFVIQVSLHQNTYSIEYVFKAHIRSIFHETLGKRKYHLRRSTPG